jgi:hypothetical protein
MNEPNRFNGLLLATARDGSRMGREVVNRS